MNVAAKNFSESQAFRNYRFGYTLNTGLAHSRHLRYDQSFMKRIVGICDEQTMAEKVTKRP